MKAIVIACVAAVVLAFLVMVWSLCRIAAISDRRADEAMEHREDGRDPWRE